MFIHIGDRESVSDRQLIGIFNRQVLEESENNSYFLEKTDSSDKTLAVLEDNSVITSRVSPFTVITRTEFNSDAVWRKK